MVNAAWRTQDICANATPSETCVESRPRALVFLGFVFAASVAAAFITDAVQAQGAAPPAAGTTAPAADHPGKAIFLANCTTCHTIGVVAIGPNLQGVNKRAPDKEWLKKFIRNPNETLDSTEYGKKLKDEWGKTGKGFAMTPFPSAVIEDSKLDALVDFILADFPGIEPAKPVIAKPFALVSQGRDYFVGREHFKNGGAACITCHTTWDLGELGGRLAGATSDLSSSHNKFGAEGLKSMLMKPVGGMMGASYEGHAIEATEAEAVVAYMESMSQGVRDDHSMSYLALWALLGAIMMLAYFELIRPKQECGDEAKKQ